MEDRTQERLIASAKYLEQLKMQGHDIMAEEARSLEHIAYAMSGEGNRKQRRAFASRNRRNGK